MNNKINLDKYINQVFLKDILELLKELPDKCVDMVYGDPDYNVGIKYGDKSYTRTFDEYIEWYIGLAKESLRVLKDTGNMFFVNYPKQNAYLRVKYLDNACYGISDYVWIYNTNVGHSPKRFTTAHRSILHCRKTKDNKFYKENVAVPYKNPNDKRILNNLAKGSKGRMPYCFDDQTEILTKRGFILFKELSKKDYVASLDSENKFCWVKPFDIIEQDYDGKMYLYEGKSVNFCITPDHYMYVKKSYGNKRYKFLKIDEMKGNYYYLNSFCDYAQQEIEYFYLPKTDYDNKHKYLNKGQIKVKMDDWLKFLGLYIAEGWVNEKEHSIGFLETKHKKIVEEIIKTLPFNFKKQKRDGSYRCRNKQLCDYLKSIGKAKNKYIPREFLELSKRQLNILYESLMLGDGNKQNNSWTYTTISKKLADNIQEILIKLGYNTFVYIDNRIGKKVIFKNRIYERRLESYCVRRKISKTTKIIKKNIKVIDYSGKVYCCSVPTHIILTRRKEQLMWSGNSWFYFDLVKNVSKEKTFHACQIPQKLAEMLIKSCTMPGDIVLILFGGSGAEIEVCKNLKRQYISAEIDEKYHKMIIDRLKNGYIEKKYKLKLNKKEINNIEKQPTLFDQKY